LSKSRLKVNFVKPQAIPKDTRKKETSKAILSFSHEGTSQNVSPKT